MTSVPERLTADDGSMLRLESAAVMGHTCKVVIVEPRGGDDDEGHAIELEELRQHVEARLGRVRRCRQRVAFPPVGVVPPAWVDYPEFEIEQHVCRYEVDGPVDRVRLRAIAAELMAEKLDHRLPLWRMDLVGPLQGGGSAVVWRIHHCMADGVTATRLGGQILWDTEPDPAPPQPDRWDPEPEPSGWSLVGDAIAGELGSAASAIPALSRDLVSPSRWANAAKAAARLPGALVRELTPLGSSSPLDRHIGSRRELAFVHRPLDELRTIEAGARERLGAHVTINDVLLAAIAASIRSWLGSGAAPATRIRAQVPVSLHHRDERADELGNRDSFLFVDLPVDERDPIRRLEAINSETAVRKGAHDAETMYAFFHALSRLGPVGREAAKAAAGPHEFSLAASNVPGPRQPVYVLGRPVAELYAFAEPADRHALRFTALSCGGRMHLGLCTDPDALGDLDVLAAGLDDGLDELRSRC
jgi:WS/DGAT/MGAT family acyltransferase